MSAGWLTRPLPAVDAALLDMAFARVRLSLVMGLVAIAVFAGILWQEVPSNARTTWLAALLVVTALRLATLAAYRRWGRPTRGWQALFVVGATVAGASWSIGPVLAMGAASYGQAMLLSLAVLTVCAVAMPALSSQRWAMWGFQTAALAPVAVAVLQLGERVGLAAALILTAALVCVAMAGLAASRTTRGLIESEQRVTEALAQARQERETALAASQAKSRFLANMSHELRTPLNAVLGSAQLLQLGADDEGASRDALLEAIQRSGGHLLSLIDEVLDLARVEADQVELRPASFDLVACIDDALVAAAVNATGKPVELVAIVSPALGPWRRGDEARVRQLVLNLLGNAVKFTDAGEIVVEARAGAVPDAVEIEVRDTGIGIEPDRLTDVFEPFRQGDESAGRRHGGVGLGLAIVRQLVTRMGGDIELRSTPGKGSCFTMTLPLPAERPEAAAPPFGSGTAPQVLVAAPPTLARALQAQLQRLGCHVLHADRPEMLAAWGARQPVHATTWPGERVAVLALDAAGGTVDAAAWLAAAGQARVRRVLCLAAPGAGDAWAAGGHGVVLDVLPRPVTQATLARHLLPADGAAALPVAPEAPRRRATVLVVEDDPLNRTIVEGMLEHAGHRVAFADSGERALAAVRDRAYDLLLMDWQMPGMDGLETTRRLRRGDAGDAGREVPVVALTANAFAQDREDCLAAGMDDFLAKPVQFDALERVVQRWAVRAPTV